MHSFTNIFSLEAGFRQIFPISTKVWTDLLLFYMTAKKLKSGNHILVCSDDHESMATFNKFKQLNSSHFDVILFPSFSTYPVPHYLKSKNDYLRDFDSFFKLYNNQLGKKKIVICTLKDFFFKLPPKHEIIDCFTLSISMSLDLAEIPEKLVSMGYTRVDFISSPYTFSIKGSSLDIFDPGLGPIRLIFDLNTLDKIVEIDLENLRIKGGQTFSSISVAPSPYFVLENPKFLNNFRKNIKPFTLQNKGTKENLHNFYNEVKSRIFSPYFFKYYLLFFQDHDYLIDFFSLPDTYISFLSNLDMIDTLLDSPQIDESESDMVFPTLPLSFFFDLNILNKVNPKHSLIFAGNIESSVIQLSHVKKENFKTSSLIDFLIKKSNVLLYQKKDFLKEFLQHLKNGSFNGFQLFALTDDLTIKQKFLNSLKEFEISNTFTFFKGSIENSFIDYKDLVVVVSLIDFFAVKQPVKITTSSSTDLISDFFSNLKVDDYIIHKEHGVGKYLGIQKIDINSSSTDFLAIEFANKDKVYVPIYKIDLIQQCPSSEGLRKLDVLGGARFKDLKDNAKNSIKKLAFNLIKLNAERSLSKAFSFPILEDETYYEFCETFPFEETADQLKAINNVLNDLSKEKPMDRIICGDVGNGKTEVAIRASFHVAYHGKQVAILVPTTVLALQHYNTFSSRLTPFGIQVDYLSRFSTEKKTKRVIKSVNDGTTDIIIGTHKLLNKSIEFKNLELIIIDEEHKFGVNHKETFKKYKKNVHALSMTATPIPRTLQMSLLNIRDISLIKTAPKSRKPVSSYIINFNSKIIKDAINYELSRNGQVIFIHNRVQDIDEIVVKISNLIPEAKITFTHGKLAPKTLEKRITEFYNGDFNILISTAIIESGIDIPTANTIFINNAHHFGLSQLHQLKGRIGRSDQKAYAYFIIPENKVLSEEAYKRIDVLQSFSNNPSGLSVSMKDLDIRGPGDLLGAEQSGHLNDIGIELYLDLLNEAVAELKGTTPIFNDSIDLNIPISAKISDRFISTPSLRLKFYKMLSNAVSEKDIDQIVSDIFDLFGEPDKDFKNLIFILKIKLILKNLSIIQLKIGREKIEFTFSEFYLKKNKSLQDKIFTFFIGNKDKFKILKNNTAETTFRFNNNIDELLKFFKNLQHNILDAKH